MDLTDPAATAQLDLRAACLINPASGIANDYLNKFNELLLLIQNLPVLLPEMLDDLKQWQPVSYREYFQSSPLPGSARALAAYDAVNPKFREEFEAKVVEMTRLALETKQALLSMEREDGELDPDSISEPCAELASNLASILNVVTGMVNNGEDTGQTPIQQIVDNQMAAG